MKIKLKICGMRDPANIAEVAALQPEYMGFIFYTESPRYVGDDFELPDLAESIQRVGVFVNAETDTILNQVAKYHLDFVQLHGNESPDRCAELSTKVSVIKALSVDEKFDFGNLDQFKESVKYFLFDTKGKYYGGNGSTFDWNLLEKYDQQIPFFLSGGISVDNIQNLKSIKNFNIHALDVNSGVEISPGLKNLSKTKELKNVLNAL